MRTVSLSSAGIEFSPGVLSSRRQGFDVLELQPGWCYWYSTGLWAIMSPALRREEPNQCEGDPDIPSSSDIDKR